MRFDKRNKYRFFFTNNFFFVATFPPARPNVAQGVYLCTIVRAFVCTYSFTFNTISCVPACSYSNFVTYSITTSITKKRRKRKIELCTQTKTTNELDLCPPVYIVQLVFAPIHNVPNHAYLLYAHARVRGFLFKRSYVCMHA